MIRGDIYLIDFGDGEDSRGSEQYGLRPAVIVSNDIGNHYAPIVTVIPMTSKIKNTRQLTKVFCEGAECGLLKDSEIACEQIRTVSKERTRQYIGHLSDSMIEELDGALKITLGLR